MLYDLRNIQLMSPENLLKAVAWDESKHTRQSDGKFGTKGTKGAGKATGKSSSEPTASGNPENASGDRSAEKAKSGTAAKGDSETVVLFHGTALVNAEQIQKSGFKARYSGEGDMGKCAYFKSPSWDAHEEDKFAKTERTVNYFAGDNRDKVFDGRVIKAVIPKEHVLDCTNGRPDELQKMIDATAMYGKPGEQKKGTPRWDKRNSPYQAYAEKHGIKVIVDKLDTVWEDEGWQVGVYDPKIIQLIDVGKRVEGEGMSAELRKALEQAAYCLLHHEFDADGNLILHVGAQGGGLEKALFNADELRKKGSEVLMTPGNRFAYAVSHTTDPSEVLYIPVNRLSMVYQTEEATDWDKVKENMDKMKAGQALEPVVIGYDYDVHDGHHRWIAAKGLDHTHVPCVVMGINELRKTEALERYRELWKSVIPDPTNEPGRGGLPDDPYTMYRGVGQKEMDFIHKNGFVQSKGKGNDGDQGKTVTCFTNLFTQAEGYARSNYTLYGEKAAYVIALPKPPWVTENELGELESDRPVPFHVGAIIPIPDPEDDLHKSFREDYAPPKTRKKAITAKQAKGVHKDLPPGGAWRTMNGHHIYIKDGKVLAGAIPGVSGAKKATKAHLVAHQATVDKEAKKKPAAKAKAKTPAPKKPAAAKAKAKTPAPKASEVKKPVAKPSDHIELYHGTTMENTKKIMAGKFRKGDTNGYDLGSAVYFKTPEKDHLDPKDGDTMSLMKRFSNMAGERPGVIRAAIPRSQVLDMSDGNIPKELADMVKKWRKSKNTYYNNPYEAYAKKHGYKGIITEAEHEGEGQQVAIYEPDAIVTHAHGTKLGKTAQGHVLANEVLKQPKKPAAKTKAKTTEKPKKPAAPKKAAPKKGVKDIRTEAQANRALAYDVGDKVGGARKDTYVKSFTAEPTSHNLEALEKVAPEVAQRMCVKKNILPPVDFEREHKNGVEINAAMLKQLIFDRIAPKPSGERAEDRMAYLQGVNKLHRIIAPIKTYDELRKAVSELGTIARAGEGMEEAKLRIASAGKFGNSYTNVEYYQNRIDKATEAKKMLDFEALGEKLNNFFTKGDSRVRTFQTIADKRLNWDNYFKPSEDGADEKNRGATRGATKKKWERMAVSEHQRAGGRGTPIKKPEDMVKHFGMKGVEFGNWVDDASGLYHLKRSAEAFHDLADVMGVDDKDISLNGRLSMAFGARGKAGAVAHYEPDRKVINMTKHGGAGSLAHEWGHALDNIMFMYSHGGIGSMGLASDAHKQMGDHDPELKRLYGNLMDAVRKPTPGQPGGVRKVAYDTQANHFGNYYPEMRRDMQGGMGMQDALHKWQTKHQGEFDRIMGNMDASRHRYTPKDFDKSVLKYQRDLNRKLKELPHRLAQEYKNRNGWTSEHIKGEIEMPTGQSEYYTRMQEFDGGSKPYYAQGCEMFARAFESLIEDKLTAKKRKNNYLVWDTKTSKGNKDAPFPIGEERKHMHGAMDELLKYISKSKALKKALEIELLKSVKPSEV